MSDLAEWLLEQIALQDARAQGDIEHFGESSEPRDQWIEKMARQFLAECEAKRSILNVHLPCQDSLGDDFCVECDTDAPCKTLRVLALPYADRPGYRESWRP